MRTIENRPKIEPVCVSKTCCHGHLLDLKMVTNGEAKWRVCWR